MEDVSTTAELVMSRPRSASLSDLRRKRYFLLSLLACTWIPLAFFIFVAPSHTTGGFAATKLVFLFLGTAHVPATFFFYTDREFLGIIRDHRVRYIYVPIFLTVITGILFATLSVVGQAFILLAYWAWQAFHYGRQNVGVYAFASIAQTAKPPHRFEKLAIDIGTVLGILGTFKILGTAVAPAYLHGTFDRLYSFGAIAFAGLLLFSLGVYAKFFRDTTVMKTLFFFTSVFFFLPIFLSTDLNIGFLSYAIAHGLQYLIFMSIVSATARTEVSAAAAELPGLNYRSILKLLVFVAVVGFAFWRVSDLKEVSLVKAHNALVWVADFAFGAVLGATMSHFVVDASAWKLRMQAQRAYMSRRFRFLFDQTRSRTAN